MTEGTSLTGCRGHNEDSWVHVLGIEYLAKDEKHLRNDGVKNKNVLLNWLKFPVEDSEQRLLGTL